MKVSDTFLLKNCEEDELKIAQGLVQQYTSAVNIGKIFP